MAIINSPGGGTPITPPLTVQDLLDLDFLRVDANGFIINGVGANISGSPAVADQAALLALDASLYDGFALNVQSGMNNSFHASNGTAFGPLNGQYVQERQTVPGNIYIFPDNVTWVASDSGVALTQGGGNRTRLTASAAHNMLEANAEGSYLYLISGGAGWTAGTSHQIAPTAGYISGTVVDIDTKWEAGMGVPVFARAGTARGTSFIPLKTITLPALRSNTEVIIEMLMEMSAITSTASKRTIMDLDTTEIFNINFTTTDSASLPLRWGFRNQANAAVQRGIAGLGATGYASNTNLPATAAVDTAVAGKTILIGHMANLAGFTIRLSAYDLIIRG